VAFKKAVAESSLERTYEGKKFLESLHLANLDPNDYSLPTS